MNKACILVAIALFLCLFSMPYGYYIFVRFVTMALFAILAFKFYQEKNETLALVSVATAVLFQPFFKIALGRGMWNIVDVVVAVALIILVMKKKV